MSANMEIIDLTSSDSESEPEPSSKKRMPSHGAEEHATKSTKLAPPPPKLRRPLSPYEHTLDSSLFQHGVLVMARPADVFESFDMNAYLHEMPEFKTLCGKPLRFITRLSVPYDDESFERCPIDCMESLDMDGSFRMCWMDSANELLDLANPYTETALWCIRRRMTHNVPMDMSSEWCWVDTRI